MRGLKDKVVIVTGGNSGIGRAAALAFAAEGANVVIAARREADGKKVVEEIKSAGREALFVKTDVTKEDDVKRMVEAAIKTYGRLDCAFNNAGTGGKPSPMHMFPKEEFDAVIELNLGGVWLCMKYEIQEMLKNGGGAIVNMSSAAGLISNPLGFSAYTASKHGVLGLTKTGALEYAKNNIRVNAVCPGMILTPLMTNAPKEMLDGVAAIHPVGRMGSPGEVADLVVFLCSDSASFMTGSCIPVDGGIVAG